MNRPRTTAPLLAPLFALLLATAAWGQGTITPTTAPDDPLQRENHLKCYDIDPVDFVPILVTTRDQFGFSRTRVLRPVYICNPVSKNDEIVPEPEVHQLCYEIRDDTPPRGPWDLLIRNQFGEIKIRAEVPRLLCVPSYKTHI